MLSASGMVQVQDCHSLLDVALDHLPAETHQHHLLPPLHCMYCRSGDSGVVKLVKLDCQLHFHLGLTLLQVYLLLYKLRQYCLPLLPQLLLHLLLNNQELINLFLRLLDIPNL